MSDWSDMPIVQDVYLPCDEKCGRVTMHRRVAYKDIEYRTCQTCKTKTEWTPNRSAEHGLDKTGSKRIDPGRETEDRKRQEGKRRYRWDGFGKSRRGRPKKKE